MASVAKSSHELGGLCPCFRNGDHVFFTEPEPEPESVREKEGDQSGNPGFQVLDSGHSVIHFYSERNGGSCAMVVYFK